MSSSSDIALDDVTMNELESVDQYEATFSGTIDGEEITLTYTLESAIGEDDAPVYTPGDERLEHILVHPDSYEFETENRETLRFTGTDDDGSDLFLVYVFSEAEDADANEVGLTVDPDA